MKNLKTYFKIQNKILLFYFLLLLFVNSDAKFILSNDVFSDSLIQSLCCTKAYKKNKITNLHFDYKNRIINFKAKINDGKKYYDFVLDTGAPTFITDSVLHEHALELLSTTEAIDANQNHQEVNIYNINSILLSDKRIFNIEAAHSAGVNNMAVLKERANGGLIGSNAMKNSIWMIDYKNYEIKITDNVDLLQIPKNAYITKMSKDNFGCPMIKIDIGNFKKLNVVIDLAYNGSVLLPASFINKPIFNDSLTFSKNEILSTGFASEIKQNSYFFLKKLEFGNLNLKNVKCSTSGKNTRALIGNEFLENYIVILDFIHNKFILIP
ncbi:MAG: aspartyl protease family protein [Bacteroidetes bacterium]|nr:aspartyl protease family protein [Bacteroidota bacterium]